MIYKIVNPSDPYTIEANSLEIAVIASIMLGNGQYGFEPLQDGGTKIPMFAFGGVDQWCDENLHRKLTDVNDEVLDQRKAELADCLDSCLIGNLGERELFFDALKSVTGDKERHEYWYQYHDKRRSSFNDIGGRAKAIAKKLREPSAPAPDPTPQQVFVR